MVETSSDLLDGTFHALADATRRRILRDTSVRERTVGELARPHGISLAAISKHIKVLEAARLVARRKQGSYQWVRIEPGALRSAARWLAHYEQFWKSQLDSLQNHLEGGTDR